VKREFTSAPIPQATAKTGCVRCHGQGFFVILRIYGPTQAFFDKTWVPSDVEKVN
jgi:hypothetical protein